MKRYVQFSMLLLVFSLFSVSCKKHNGTNGTNGGGTTLLDALTATCTADNAAGTIAPPVLNTNVLAQNNIVGLNCNYDLNHVTDWSEGDIFFCVTNSSNNIQTYNNTSGTSFLWPGNGTQFVASTQQTGTVSLGDAYYCTASCIATYGNGSSAYIMLIGGGRCN